MLAVWLPGVVAAGFIKTDGRPLDVGAHAVASLNLDNYAATREDTGP